jgi:hypothetical protein
MSFPAKFDQYEVFRILIPGYYFMFLVSMATASIPIPLTRLIPENLLGVTFVFGGVLLGLILYILDPPNNLEFDGFKADTEYSQISTSQRNLLRCL